jgi:hypothetical protein
MQVLDLEPDQDEQHPSQIAISGGRLALPSEGKGHKFESCRARQSHSELGVMLFTRLSSSPQCAHQLSRSRP